MTLEELKSLKRGDVVEFAYDDHETSLGLVVEVVEPGDVDAGVYVRWEDGDAAGPYSTDDDAKKLSIVSRVSR